MFGREKQRSIHHQQPRVEAGALVRVVGAEHLEPVRVFAVNLG
jgi:hypothetical protein